MARRRGQRGTPFAFRTGASDPPDCPAAAGPREDLAAGGRADGPAAPPEDPAAGGPPEDPEGVARRILLRRLTEQPRSRAELTTALAKKRVPDEVAGRVLDRFEEVGLVDDAAFAAAWVESRHTGRGLARRALAEELRRRGVADEVARDAVGSVQDDDEQAAAHRLVERRLPALGRLDRVRAERRLVGMLARRGYRPGVAMPAVREALAGWDASGDEPVEIGHDTADTPLDLR